MPDSWLLLLMVLTFGFIFKSIITLVLSRLLKTRRAKLAGLILTKKQYFLTAVTYSGAFWMSLVLVFVGFGFVTTLSAKLFQSAGIFVGSYSPLGILLLLLSIFSILFAYLIFPTIISGWALRRWLNVPSDRFYWFGEAFIVFMIISGLYLCAYLVKTIIIG
ncbi:hypothetical protein OAP53_00330 [Alphaproteobacteria bacterium]|nr:hypothetical protein [Alphaproteobacteria bacterium]